MSLTSFPPRPEPIGRFGTDRFGREPQVLGSGTCNKVRQATTGAFGKSCAVCGLAGSCMKLQPHQERVIDERVELEERIRKLTTFIAEGPQFKQLPAVERGLLREQAKAMSDYSDILLQRIQNWSLPA